MQQGSYINYRKILNPQYLLALVVIAFAIVYDIPLTVSLPNQFVNKYQL